VSEQNLTSNQKTDNFGNSLSRQLMTLTTKPAKTKRKYTKITLIQTDYSKNIEENKA